ncbi:metallophosphoesterase [Candidatus Puniceispirillum sp.]|nr:metallophosphoesterase [Candidatus Puniceispirillum sp.]
MREFTVTTTIFVLTFLIYIYPLNILTHLLLKTKIVEYVAIIPTAIIALAVFVYFRTHAKSPLLRGFIYYGMGIGFIGFCVFNIGLLTSLIFPKLALEIGFICLFISSITCVKSISNGRSIHLKKICLTSQKINQDINLIFISDVHLGSNSKQHFEKICNKIDGLKYDCLLIGGDLFDSSAFDAGDLNPIKAIQKPVLFVTGNHEYYVKDHQEKIARLANYNIRILDNQSLQLGALNIIGISDNQAPKIQSEISQSLISQDKFNLLLVHQPSMWKSAPKNTDLMLSGHTHNGQIFPFNLLVRLQFKTVYGIYKRLNSSLYVSSGSGTWGPRMRLGTKNEIIQILISPKT